MRGLVGQARFLDPRYVSALVCDSCVVVDLRAKVDYDKYHLDDAVNMPHSTFVKDWPASGLQFSGKRLIFVCYTGHTSTWVAALLYTQGVDTYTMKFGMNAVAQPV